MLNLSKNNISTIEGLRELTRLRILDLSYNRIVRIGHGMSLFESQFLKIAHCHLVYLLPVYSRNMKASSKHVPDGSCSVVVLYYLQVLRPSKSGHSSLTMCQKFF